MKPTNTPKKAKPVEPHPDEFWEEIHSTAKVIAQHLNHISSFSGEITDVTHPHSKARAVFEFPWKGGFVQVMCSGHDRFAMATVSCRDIPNAPDSFIFTMMHFENSRDMETKRGEIMTSARNYIRSKEKRSNDFMGNPYFIGNPENPIR